MPIYRPEDVTMVWGGLDVIRHGRVAAAPLNQESPTIELPVLGRAYTETRGGAPTASIPLDVYADDGTYSILTRIKAQADDDEGVPLSYGVHGTGAGKRVWHFPQASINGYGVTPTLGGYTRATATLTSGDVTYEHGIVVQDWATIEGDTKSNAPARTVAGQDSEPDAAQAINGVDLVRDGSDDYLVFATASGARVPVTAAGDKWELIWGGGSVPPATWTPPTVTLAASDTGRAEITAGLTANLRTQFEAAQTAGAIMAAKPVETNDGGIVVWYVESANYGDRERLRFRLWERSAVGGTWGAARAFGFLPHTAALPAAVVVDVGDAPNLRYLTSTHQFDQGAGTDDDSLQARFRCEFIRHMTYTQL